MCNDLRIGIGMENNTKPKHVILNGNPFFFGYVFLRLVKNSAT